MPAEMERRLKEGAKKKGLSGKRAAAYVYGTMRRTGWTPSTQKKHTMKVMKDARQGKYGY